MLLPVGEGPLVPTGPSCAGTGGPVPPLAPHVRALLPPFSLFVLSVASFSFFGASPTLRVPLPPLQSPAKGRRFALFLRHGTPTQACLLAFPHRDRSRARGGFLSLVWSRLPPGCADSAAVRRIQGLCRREEGRHLGPGDLASDHRRTTSQHPVHRWCVALSFVCGGVCGVRSCVRCVRWHGL